MNRRLQTLKYIFFDLLSAAIAWLAFFTFRKMVIESDIMGYQVPVVFNKSLILGLTIIPVYWVTLYALFGTYKKIYRRSRLRELVQTLNLSVLGVIVLFFALLLDDEVGQNYRNYYLTVPTLLFLHFTLTAFFRFVLTSDTKRRLTSREIGFRTLLIGSNQKAKDLFNELESERKSQGYQFVGFVTVNNDVHMLEDRLKHFGNYVNLPNIIKEQGIEEVIIAVESSEHHKINEIINLLEDESVYIKIIPDMYDILTGTVKMNHIFGTVLIEVEHEIMPDWQKNAKRFMDILTSLLVLVLFSPLYLFLAIGVKLSSKGPIFYKQERIGLHGKPFYIYKFRSMRTNAESSGPALSSKDDKRVTKFGKKLRKYRLDELPQFYNVLIGEMSLVGPRPERTFFIEQIMQQAPHYKHLHKVKPGITSWGQVKYGYAENVDEMIERLKFDILYIENMSLAVDFKILVYTVLIILQGSGK